MTRIKLDTAKLLGFRLLSGATSAKNGIKVRSGSKSGGKLGQKVGGKLGQKVGVKTP